MSDRRITVPILSIRVLGRVVVETTQGREVRLPGRHAQALLALLALARRPRTREAIATDLWPDAPTAATGSLRQALYQLRTALVAAGLDPDEILDADAETLGLRAGSVARLDSVDFEHCTDDPACDTETAITSYGGDLAEGLGLDCFAAERERLADRFEDALAVASERRLEAGDVDGARSAAERLIARDPLREEAHAVLIAVHGLAGTRSQVVRQYRRLCEVLERELGEVPLPETDATYRVALRRTIERSRERAAMIDGRRRTDLAVVDR